MGSNPGNLHSNWQKLFIFQATLLFFEPLMSWYLSLRNNVRILIEHRKATFLFTTDTQINHLNFYDAKDLQNT